MPTETEPGSKTRKADYPIHNLFLDRWSPRAMSGEPIDEKELMTLFEAARWAPSCYNGQPWRILYARRDTSHWDTYFGLLGEFNQAWCGNAAALIVIVSKETFDHNGKPAITHSYDTGAAWMSMALQGWMRGYVVHGMQGFDYGRAQSELGIPEGYTVEAMAAVGKAGSADALPPELRQREEPSPRRPLTETVSEGKFSL